MLYQLWTIDGHGNYIMLTLSQNLQAFWGPVGHIERSMGVFNTEFTMDHHFPSFGWPFWVFPALHRKDLMKLSDFGLSFCAETRSSFQLTLSCWAAVQTVYPLVKLTGESLRGHSPQQLWRENFGRSIHWISWEGVAKPADKNSQTTVLFLRILMIQSNDFPSNISNSLYFTIQSSSMAINPTNLNQKIIHNWAINTTPARHGENPPKHPGQDEQFSSVSSLEPCLFAILGPLLGTQHNGIT